MGLGASVEKLHYLPEAHTDFLMAVVGEELGFAGVMLVISLFAIIVYRGFDIGRQAIAMERTFAGLVAHGVAMWFGVQAFINMGVCLGLLPTKGLTLPLMSYGGSGVVMNLCALAMLIRVDVENRVMMRGDGYDERPTILIMAGGTGGHIMPGLAVADVLRQRGWRVLWLGNPDKMEGRLVPPRGIELVPLRFAGVRGKGAAALLCCRSCCCALRPGLGTAVRRQAGRGAGHGRLRGLPGGVIAARCGHAAGRARAERRGRHGQQMAGPDVAPRAQRFPGVLPKGEALGNPVRADLCALPDPAQRYGARAGALRLLVVGGSLGAQALNTTVPQALARMPADRRPTVIHQAGEQHLPALQQAYAQAGVQADCRAFIEDMAGALGDADLLICRAGAMTVSEVAAAGVAALFVPFPHAIDDHQTANARFLSDAQAAWLQPQPALTPEWLADWLAGRTRQELQAVAERARAHAPRSRGSYRRRL